MSKPGGRRAPKSSTRNPPPPAEDTTDRSIAPTAGRIDIETKDDASSNGDKKDAKGGEEAAATAPAAKPQSAGATIRDAGQRLLSLTMKQEWTSIDPVMKQLEKIVASNASEASAVPLAGVMDPVSIQIPFFFFAGMIDDRNGLRQEFLSYPKAVSDSYRSEPELRKMLCVHLSRFAKKEFMIAP